MLFCKKCGAQLDDDAVFCHLCGTTVPKTKTSDRTQTNADRENPAAGQTIQLDGPLYGVVDLENLPEGHIIDERYEIKAKIGRGGFGAVYRAYDRKMKIDKALKVIPDAISNDLRAMANLRREAQTMIRLNHSNIVRVYDFQEEGAVKYIDMEYIDGKSLNELLLDYLEQKMPESEVKEIALQIAEGLSYAHKQHVIHRDMIIITAISVVPLICYYIFLSLVWGGMGAGGDRNAGYAALIGLAAFVMYFVTNLLVLYVSRIREYYADAGSAEMTGKPYNLASGLYKLILASKDIDEKELQRVEGVKAFFATDPSKAKGEIRMLIEADLNRDGKLDAYEVKRFAEEAKARKFSSVAELFSTHPNPVKRIIKLGEMY